MNLKKLGVALAGGGGKGAYQIGVWNALKETGLEKHIAAIAGTSVGGLNGAMMAQGKYELAEKMWLKVERHNVLTLEGLAGLAESLAQKLPPGRLLSHLLSSAASKGLFKREGLQNMIAEGVDTTVLANSTVPLTVTWHHGIGNRVVYRTLRDPAIVADGLLATAALPLVFDEVHIEGELYSDGGFYWGMPHRKLDNIPVKALQDAGCDTVIVICLSQDDLTVDPRQYPGMRIIPIVPRRTLGNVMATLDFSNNGAARRMEQGYADAKEILRHLNMYLDTDERYQQLWERIAHNAVREKEIDAQTAGVEAEHGAITGKITDFDKIVAADSLDRPLDLRTGEENPLPSSFSLASDALLSELDRERIQTNVERFLSSSGQDRNAVEQAVLDAIAALAPVAGRAGAMRDEGLMSRMLGALTGRTQKVSADNQLGLAEGQYALLRLLNAVQRQGALSLEFSYVLQNRLQVAMQDMARQGQRHNQDLERVYRSMAQVYEKLRDGLVQHNERIIVLERQVRLLSWLSHPNAPRYHQGRRLAELAPALRLVTLANDFFHRTEGAWTVDELMSAHEMCHRVGLGETTLTAGAFFSDLLEDRLSASALSQGLVARPLPAPPGGAAGWLLDLRNRRLCGGMEHTVACWNYGADAELAAWDLLVELLYHMRAAGLAPIRHGSEMSALKEEWSAQLGTLDGLIVDGLLPAAFRREIEPVCIAIDSFRLKVPLVGKFSAGKSSLINRWLDREVQEVDLGACTSAPVEFHVAAGGQEKLVVCWAPPSAEAPPVREEFADAYMLESRIETYARGRSILHIERHCDMPALRRYPDLVVVDTPGLGSSNIDHDSALAHYLGDGVLFILCANRGQIGTDEHAFIRRQKQLGQEFSLLVCQEDLNNASEREGLQRSLAEQAGLAKGQLVRGSSAHDGNLAGFDDLLAHVERSKTSLFVNRHRPLVEALVQRAERLLEQNLAMSDDGALRQRMGRINGAMVALDSGFRREEQAFISDCTGSVAHAVVAEVGNFMRARRSAYAERLEAGQEIRSMIIADAQNAFELATRKHFTVRLERAARVLEQHAHIGEIGGIGTLDFGSGDSGSASSSTFSGSAAGGGSGAMFGAAAGSLVPLVGTAIGLVLGGLIGVFMLGKGKRVTAENRANEAIEQVCAQVEGQAARLLEAQAREALESLRQQIEARLETEREHLARIEDRMQEHASKKEEMKKRAEAALAQVRTIVGNTNTNTNLKS